MKLLIKGGRVVDTVNGTITEADLLVLDDKIARIEPGIDTADAPVINARGKLVVPGLVDMHVHLREPGYEAKETIDTGCRAAARGGFTSVACMPNTNPVADNNAVIRYIVERAREANLVNVYPVGALTKGSRGIELSEMDDMKAAGAVALSDDGYSVANAGLMRRVMQYAAMVGLPVISHCEDKELSGAGVMHEGYVSTMLGLPGIPACAEDVIVARDIILAEATGCPLHIAHVSTAGSLRFIREAKARGVAVTAEVTPHHFTMTHEAVVDYNTSTKVNPPLRTPADVEAIREGLRDGTIDVIATDHAPHCAEEKNVEYNNAPFGMVGLETALGLVWTELVGRGVLDPVEAIRKMTLNPARILGLNKGALSPGADADITLIDTEREEVVDPADFAGKGKNSPFIGWKLRGVPVVTVVGGRVVYKR